MRDGAAYGIHKARCRERQRLLSLAGRDIGKVPAVDDPCRRSAALASVAAFAAAYLERGGRRPMATPSVWKSLASSPTVHAPDERSAVAFALWASLSRTHDPVLIASKTRSFAEHVLMAVKFELELNNELHADFPEVTHPIRWLQQIYQRRPVYQGRPVIMSVLPHQIVLPDLASSTPGPRILAVKRTQAQIATAGQHRPLTVVVAEY